MTTTSYFEVMMTNARKYETELKGSISITLAQQFRMQSTLASIVSAISYDGILKTGVKDEDRKPPLGFYWPQKGAGVALMNINGEEADARVNRLECIAAIMIAINILEANGGSIIGEHILILTSYSEQKALIIKD